tara:strand:- start:151 stop:675 length:525 start_codon:yes stop_codon:yes gene_type:complete
MAYENVTGSLSFKILPEEIRKRFKGSMSYNGVDANDKWIYKKVLVTESAAALIGTADDFLTVTNNADDPAAATDNVRFIIIKHTGYISVKETDISAYGVLISFDNTAPAWNTTAAAGTPLFLAPGDTIAIKIPNTQLSELKAITCAISSNIPSGVTTSTQDALVEIAAIVDDGA